jgi:hypothetical protein
MTKRVDGKPGDTSHKPALHVEEVARMASSVETDKTPKNVLKVATRRIRPPPEDELGGGDICSLEWKPPTDDDKPLD